jgi:DNA polymerase-1
MMKNFKGFPTNALYGFINMINKIINEEKPEYMVVALDKGKTFRHDQYADYKAGRMETPDELKVQFGVAKTILDNMGIKYIETDGYEADDIIGTISNRVANSKDYIATIISSDKDLLQLINDKVEVKLLKSQDYMRLTNDNFEKEFGFPPIKMIDLKGLQGDPSDNIKGVKGIGEKTALKLIQEYQSVEGIYENIDKISGKLKEKLIEDKENAFKSKTLATIVKDMPLDVTFDDIKYDPKITDELIKTFEELEFYSFLKNIKKTELKTPKGEITIVGDINSLDIKGEVGIYLEILGENYHTGKILGMGIYNENNSLYVPFEILKQQPKFLTENIKYTYNLKKIIVALHYQGINIDNVTFDTMLASYLFPTNLSA